MTEQNIPQNDQSIDPFQLALQKRQQAEKERENAKNNQQWGDYEQTEAVGLVQGKEVVGRIIGNPIEIRKQSTDPKLILQSEVVKDDKKGYWKIIQMVGFVYGQIYYKKEYIHWHEDKRGLAKFQKATESH